MSKNDIRDHWLKSAIEYQSKVLSDEIDKAILGELIEQERTYPTDKEVLIEYKE